MIIRSSDSGPLTDNDKEFVDGVISRAEEAYGSSAVSLLAAVSTTGAIPRELYEENLAGGIAYDRVSQVPAFQVRGKNYMKDSKKINAGAPIFFLRGMQVVRSAQFMRHVALEEWCGYPKHSHENEWLILNYLIPGATCVHVVALYTATPEAADVLRTFGTGEAIESATSSKMAWSRLLQQFWTADTGFCNDRFKLIPSIAEGSWTIKMAVGQKPALTGKKLKQHYFRGPGYFEIDIDVSSSSVATSILGMVRGVSKSMVVDLGVSIQGEREDELPEAILCQTRFARVDLDSAVPI